MVRIEAYRVSNRSILGRARVKSNNNLSGCDMNNHIDHTAHENFAEYFGAFQS